VVESAQGPRRRKCSRLRKLVEAAKGGIRAEQEAATRRLGRWLSQSKVPEGEAQEVIAREARVYEEAAEALNGARLELDQAALVQLA
jgi:hypothetical protein